MRSRDEPVRLLFVCWGNICRSPTAEVVMRRLVDEAGLSDQVIVDSAGTSDEHAGGPPDRRACSEAQRRGLDMADLRARKVEARDFEAADLVLVVDEVNERRVRALAPESHRAKVHRLTAFGPDADVWPDVPDPYYGGEDGFTLVFDILVRACRGLLEYLRTSGHVHS